ncbi:hypothetical protein F5J12DRAFT_174056 [Pisolithus orientalis]|uniref:uncharacterized protein n=1 Tax=Pisolithus orientalis TaxID=936130 RepID=UPI002224F974|nr:uncharacterized protein F5J12DRAFT_174056 [Pisolithus orientalis]KAI5982686.1 hypothetical protein F5J12DRAFT_174056 [Pisolithus orientalis]
MVNLKEIFGKYGMISWKDKFDPTVPLVVSVVHARYVEPTALLMLQVQCMIERSRTHIGIRSSRINDTPLRMGVVIKGPDLVSRLRCNDERSGVRCRSGCHITDFDHILIFSRLSLESELLETRSQPHGRRTRYLAVRDLRARPECQSPSDVARELPRGTDEASHQCRYVISGSHTDDEAKRDLTLGYQPVKTLSPFILEDVGVESLTRAAWDWNVML